MKELTYSWQGVTYSCVSSFLISDGGPVSSSLMISGADVPHFLPGKVLKVDM